jgi:hypothetical protein
MEPIEPPWEAIKEWIPDDEPDLNWFNQERDPTGTEPECYDQSPDWRPVEIPLGDGSSSPPRPNSPQFCLFAVHFLLAFRIFLA